ncbi:hypothetical protein [Streptomyces sp. NPDC007905]|uniref:hypothetical protein n=1 Tax=Streptomyces sp. NPDC007905 TaxID=3364788 RepID=UPI0036E9828D
MSGSPKYSFAELDRIRQQQLAEQRRQREERARLKRERERDRRVRAERKKLTARRSALAGRVAGQRDAALATGEVSRHSHLTTVLTAVADAIASARDEPSLEAAWSALATAEEGATALDVAVSAALARQERSAALAVLESGLAAFADRAELDREGAEEVAAALDEARRQAGSPDRFPAARLKAADAAERHLRRAQERREVLARARRQAEQAHQELAALVSEAEQAGAGLDGLEAARPLLRQLSAAADRGHLPEITRLTGQARDRLTTLAAAFDAWLDELACVQIVLDAVRRALPAAGLRLEAGSVQSDGTSSMLTARRVSGDRIVMAVVADGSGGAQLVYEAEGHDFVTRLSASGEERSCDLTAEVLERFQEALEPEGVRAGELTWDGKPERPPAREAKQLPTDRFRERR